MQKAAWGSLSVNRLLVPGGGNGKIETPPGRFCVSALIGRRFHLKPKAGSRHEAQDLDTLEGVTYLTLPDRQSALSYQAQARSPVEVIQIGIPFESFIRFTEGQPHGRRLQELEGIFPLDTLLVAAARSLLRFGRARTGEEYATSAAQFLAAHLLASVPHQSRLTGSSTPGTSRFSAVIDYMHENFARPIRVEDLARLAGLSRYHFIRLFSSVTGRTPHQFLTGLRMERACWWLEHSEESIASVGRCSGYANAKHFAAAFRREIGCSPLQYRQQYGS